MKMQTGRALGVGFMLMCLMHISGVIGLTQVSQTGTLSGTVTDDEKSPLPGVNVMLASPALILPELAAVTSGNGHFRFPALPPGVYVVKFELSGFTSITRQGIRVSAGMVSTVNVTMAASAIQEAVVVTGAAPIMDIQRPTLTTSLTTDFLQNIPSNRNIGEILTMLPGVVGRSSHGSPERDNSYNLDGVNITDPVVGTQNVTFSLEIMDELSVNTGALPAEHGSVRGAVVNVITKSGGNNFSGGVNIYFRNDKLQSNNTVGTPLEGQFVGFDSEVDAGLYAGGPVIRDKLWFFTNITLLNSRSYVAGYPFGAISNAPIDEKRLLPYLKLTYQPSAKDKFVLSYNYSSYRTDHNGAARTKEEEATTRRFNPGHTPNFLWTHFFSSNFYSNFKIAYSYYGYDVLCKTKSPSIYDTILRRYYNGNGFSNETVRDRLQALADGTYFLDNWIGRHEFKFGVEHELSWESAPRENYTDPDLGEGQGSTFYVNNGVPDYLIHQEDFIRKTHIRSTGAYIQDTWNPINRLSLNLGLRFEHQEGIVPRQGQDRRVVTYQGAAYDPQVYETFKPIVWSDFSPRFGLTYDIFGNSNTLFKASFSRYTAPIIMQYFVQMNPNSLMSWRYRLNPDWTITGNPYLFSATAAARFDPNLTAMFTREFTIGLERALSMDWKFSFRYIRKWDRNIVEDVDMNALDINELENGNLVWTNFRPISVTDPYDGREKTFWAVVDTSVPSVSYLTNVPEADRDYDAVELTIDKKLSNKWQMATSYVWSHARGLLGTSSGDSSAVTSFFSNPNVHVNAYGRSSLDRKHQFKFHGTWQAPWDIFLSGFFRYLSGLPYTRTIRSQDFGLRLPQGNVAVLAEEKGSRELPALIILDLRLEKAFNLGGGRGKLGFMVDMFNVLNANTTTGLETTSSSPAIQFERMTSITDPRIIRLGVRYQF